MSSRGSPDNDKIENGIESCNFRNTLSGFEKISYGLGI